jgi:branched-subunit amino acid aminotransferase/4-amino-4-deoxychorismate lyase
MLDTNGLVAEGPTSNIFLIRGNSVETPTIENVLPGITRKVIMKILDDMGYPEKETHIRPGDIAGYEEAFFSGTLNPVQPISRIEDRSLCLPGSHDKRDKDRMTDIVTGRAQRYENLLTYIS